jgi:hypothetical protein
VRCADGESPDQAPDDRPEEACRAHAPGPKRGRTTTADERALASAILTALAAARVEGARCDAVATRRGHPAKLRTEIPIGATKQLARALAKAQG